MSAAPALLDGAIVLAWYFSERPIGRIGDDGSTIAVHALAICAYERSETIYRFACGRDWDVLQDSDHESLEEARQSALRLYGVPLDAWRSDR
ncbi:MAG: hypothetical protein GC150_12975 [Rhizobiales bacterium]|nr:hypothetical protein [Hyphomicrobiales bacterium]